jgi:hypothetical protein
MHGRVAQMRLVQLHVDVLAVVEQDLIRTP